LVIEEAARASKLLRNLMHMARPQPPERGRCALEGELAFVLALLAPQLRRAAIRVVTEIENPPTIWADAGQIRQVILNLVQNAAQALASHRGERILTVRLLSIGDRARLEVLDTGPGIRPEALPRIFEAFFTTKPAGEGTGLGLWVASAIVTTHEGRLWAERRPEGGAAFMLEVPLARLF
jgi:signal transduction histidine kinase